MKYLIMTEGTCEKALIDVLIEKKLLFLKREDLLYEDVHHKRQITNSLIEMINQMQYEEKIIIIRIGDKLSDKLKIPKIIESKIAECIKILIKPEFEILHLLYLEKADYYLRCIKSKNKPCEYLVNLLPSYVKSYEFNYNYFMSLSSDELIALIKCYRKKRSKTHENDEKCLDYLLINTKK